MSTTYELAHAYETVNAFRSGGVAKIELNRPESMNAWNAQFGSDLLAAIASAAGDPEVRAVLLTGAGPGFSSGADLKDPDQPMTPEGRPDVHLALTERYHPIILGLRTLEKPVVSAVHGPVVGIGLARATELAMLGERLPPPKALDWGLINRVVPDAELGLEADALAARLAAGPTRSYAGTKRQLNAWKQRGIEDQLELEATIQREMAGSSDFAEGVMAFVQKRQASFKGT